MASRFWILGTGNWDASTTTQWSTTDGGTGGASVPTASDDVFFTASSGGGTVTVTATANCLSFTSGAFTGAFTFNAGVIVVNNITLPTTAITIGGSFGFTVSGTSSMTFNGCTISGGLAVTSASSNVTFADTARIAGTLTHSAGTLNTNSKAATIGAYSNSASSSSRTLTLGSSAISMSGNWTNNTAAGITVTANTATLTLTGANSAGMGGGSVNYNGLSVVFTGGGAMGWNCGGTVNALTFTGTAVKTGQVVFSTGVTITNAFTVTGSSATSRLLLFSSVLGTARSISAGSVSLSNVDFQDITNSGTTWTGSSLGDALGNTGITFDTPVTQTHTSSAGGNWSDVTKWTSRVPLPQDNVIVNVNTTGTLTADMPRLGADITLTGFTGTLALGNNVNAYGSWTSASGMVLSGNFSVLFSGRSTQTLTSAGIQFPSGLQFSGFGGTYTLQDALSVSAALTHNNGTLTTANFTVTMGSYNSSSGATRTFNGGTSTLNISATANGTVWTQTGSGVTLNLTTTTMVISTVSANTRTFAGAGLTFGTLQYTVAGSTGSLIITGSNTFTAINFSDTTVQRSFFLPSATTTTVTTFNVNGTSGIPMAVTGSTTGSAATLALPAGVTTCNYDIFKDMTVTGGTIKAVNGQLVSGTTGIALAYARTAAGVRTAAGTRQPANFLFLPGVVANYANTPSSTALQITGDIDLRWYGAAANWKTTVAQVLIAKEAGGTTRSYVLRLSGAGGLQLYLSGDGNATPNFTSSVVIPATNETAIWLRATWVQSTTVVTFYTSTDGVTWAQLGATGTIAIASISSQPTATLEIGTRQTGTVAPFAGKVFYAEVRNGINGTVVANPDFRGYVSSGFSDSVGNVWTVNSSGVTPAQLINRSPTNHLLLPGVANNYASTPTSSGLQITGNIDIRLLVAMDNWAPTALSQVLLAKEATSSTVSYTLYVDKVSTGNKLHLYTSSDGTAALDNVATVSFTPTKGTLWWVRATLQVNDGAGNRVANFYTSTDGVTWAQLGTTVTTVGATSINSNASAVNIGSFRNGSNPLAGKVFYAEVRSGINGTIVASPDFRGNVASGFSDSNGNVWTVNTSGATPAALVSRTTI